LAGKGERNTGLREKMKLGKPRGGPLKQEEEIEIRFMEYRKKPQVSGPAGFSETAVTAQ